MSKSKSSSNSLVAVRTRRAPKETGLLGRAPTAALLEVPAGTAAKSNHNGSFLATALDLAKMGFLVVPADRRHPILKGWPTAATCDPEQIRKWIPQYETASVAIVIQADGDQWAIDADVPEWLQERWGQELPRTATVRSGGGGLHLYFQHDDYSREKLGPLRVNYIPNPESNSEDRKLLEIFADTHSLQAPGTVHYKTGIIYRWEKNGDMPPQTAPHRFVDFLLGLSWVSNKTSANTEVTRRLTSAGCRVREDKKVEDLFAELGLKKEPTPEGFTFHPVHTEKCPAAGRKHRGSSSSTWLFFYVSTTRQLRFYCNGGSCAPDIKKDRTRAVLESLGAKPGDWLTDDRLGKIVIGSARIHDVVEQCEKALMEAKNERLYRHGSELVHVTLGNEQIAQHPLHEPKQTDEHDEHPDIHRPVEVPFLVPVTRFSLHLALSRTERVFKCDKDGNMTLADPPEKWGSLIMDRLVTAADTTPWSCIRFVTNSPTLLPNGDVIEAEGYHEESGIWLHKRGVEFPPIPHNPTLTQAQEAMKAFEAIYHRFDFRITKPDQKWNETPAYSALLSTILSVVVRNLVPTVPMLAIAAPVAGTGKTLLADTIFGVTTGMESVTVPFDNTEEFDKLLPTILRQGTRLVLIDNVDSTLRSARLCVALTQKGPLTYRILGESRNVQVENPSVFIATGNNLAISGDLPRRTLETRLDPNCEHPEYRRFEFDPRRRALQSFPQLVVAALTAVRAYMLAGCPRGSVSADTEKFDFGSFTEWDNLIRGCMLWLGYSDPLTTQEGIEDPMKGTDLHILATWHEMWRNEEHTISDIGRCPETELHRALLGGRRDWDPGVVSHILRKLRDRVIGDYKLIKAQESTHGAKYRVTRVGTNNAPNGDRRHGTAAPKRSKFQA